MTVNFSKLCEKFGYGEFVGIAENVLDRIDAEELENVEEAVFNAMNDALIYYDDQWDMMKYYCSPQTADFDSAWNDFYDDLIDAIINYNVLEEE